MLLSRRDEIDAWWEDHRDLRLELMRMVVREWSFGATPVVLSARVDDVLDARRDELPCDPGAFRELYFARFWPRF